MSTSVDHVKSYLADVAAQWKTGAATELSYRAALAALLADLIPRVTVVNEPAHIACGAPDLLVRSNGATHAPVGYVETKDVGDGDLDGNGRNKERFDRYKQDLDNIVFTDYLDFRFHTGGPRSVAAADGTEPVPPEVLQLPLLSKVDALPINVGWQLEAIAEKRGHQDLFTIAAFRPAG